MMHDYGLNDKQRRFCEEYIIDLNATQSYFRAGYVESGDFEVAASNAHRLLLNAEIQAYIQQLMNERAVRTGITADEVLKEYAAIAFSNITDAIEIKDSEVFLKDDKLLPKEVSCAIASVSSSISEGKSGVTRKASIRMHDKLKALDALARHTGVSSDFNQCVAGLRRYGFHIGVD
ncbi:MAG: terminase small subunit, partial [Hydrococcus sp. CRU_1_1]|nr:terminase small subunit [Hydrococcus sp. CRU_1_1]